MVMLSPTRSGGVRRRRWWRWVGWSLAGAVGVLVLLCALFPDRALRTVIAIWFMPWFPQRSGVARPMLASSELGYWSFNNAVGIRMESPPGVGFFVRRLADDDVAAGPGRVVAGADWSGPPDLANPAFDESRFAPGPGTKVWYYDPAAGEFTSAAVENWRAQATPAQHGFTFGYNHYLIHSQNLPAQPPANSTVSMETVRSWRGAYPRHWKAGSPAPTLQPFQLLLRGVDIGMPEPYCYGLHFSPSLEQLAVLMNDGGWGRSVKIMPGGPDDRTWYGREFVALYETNTGRRLTEVYEIPSNSKVFGWTPGGEYLVGGNGQDVWVLPNPAFVKYPAGVRAKTQ